MKSQMVVVSGIVAAALSFPALAQAHESYWYLLKHPEMKVMADLRAQAANGGSAHTLAVSRKVTSSAAASRGQIDWADLKHPELRTMARMRAQEARGNVAMHGVMAHHVGSGQDPQTHKS